MVLIEVLKQLNNIYNFKEYDYELREIFLKLRNKEFYNDKEIYVNNILKLIEVDYSNMDFQTKKDELVNNIGWISLNQHRKFKELWVARYISEEVSWNNLWNKFYEEARGTAFEIENFTIINRTPNKFYNYGEVRLPKEVVHEWIDNAVRMEFSNKEDGSFIAMGFYKGELIVNTPGSFQSKEALVAYQMLTNEEKYKKLIKYIHDNPKQTLCAEFIHPQHAILIDYKNLKDIILHTIVNKENGIVSMYSDVAKLAQSLNVSSATIEFNDFSCIKYIGKEHFKGTEKEGWVGIIEHKNGSKLMVKIKCEDYCNLHSYLSKLQNPKHILKLVIEDKLDDIIAKIDNPSVREKVLKTAKFISNTLKELSKTSFSNASQIIENINFDALYQYSKVIHLVKNNDLASLEYNITKSDYNLILQELEKKLQKYSEKFGNKNIKEILDIQEVNDFSFNLKDNLEMMLQRRFIDKIVEHVDNFLKGNFQNKKHDIQQYAQIVFDKLHANMDNLVKRLNDYKKQKSRFQMKIKSYPKSIEKILKELENYKFNINDFIKNINLDIKETKSFDVKLYNLYKQNLVTAEEYLNYCLNQKDITIIDREQILLFANTIEDNYFIEADLIEYNILFEENIKNIVNPKTYSTIDVIKEVRKIIYQEYIDKSYDVAFKIFKDIEINKEAVKTHFEYNQKIIKNFKSLNKIDSHYARKVIDNAYLYQSKRKMIEVLNEMVTKDNDKIRYEMLKGEIYQLFIDFNKNNESVLFE